MRTRDILALGIALICALPVICWAALLLLATVRGKVSKCPNCFSTRTRTALRGIQDNFLPGFVSPFRCESCRKRFYRLQPGT